MAELIDKKSALNALSDASYGNFNYVTARNAIDCVSTTTEAEIRNRAVDEFAEKLKFELGQWIFTDNEKFAYPVKEQEQICHQNMTLKRAIKYVDYVAEQLKQS